MDKSNDKQYSPNDASNADIAKDSKKKHSKKKKHRKDSSRASKVQKISEIVKLPVATTSEKANKLASPECMEKKLERPPEIKSSKSKKRKALNAPAKSKHKRTKTQKSPPPPKNASFDNLLLSDAIVEVIIPHVKSAHLDFEKLLLPVDIDSDESKKDLHELQSKACKQVENNSTFYVDKISEHFMGDIKYFATYIRNVAEARTKAQRAKPFENSSALPTWDFTDKNALKKLHGIQSINIWLIDYLIATKTAICNNADYTKMLAIYVGKLPAIFFESTAIILILFFQPINSKQTLVKLLISDRT